MNHPRTPSAPSALALCLLLGLMIGAANPAAAFNGIGRDWRDQYPDVCSTLTTASQDCSLCHIEGGFDLNPYGSDLANANNNFLAVEALDSDGDGRTNGQEISQDCTLPGDAASVPVRTATWSSIKALFR